ncbi:MAG: type II toxin-antitoxin system HipA family toxin, partial [Actinophytocola sp.]|nr:type II toxin-antitoxin system HipA family toxin [Actinophytocola sp.]
LKTETVAGAVADVVAAGDGSRQLALRRVIELVAFSYLIGNGDLHGKNFSVRQAPAGFWEVTPVYDLLTTQPYLNWRDPMALDFYGRANRLDRDHLTESGERLGLPRAAVASALDRICDTVPTWIGRLDEIGFDAPVTERLADMMRHRITELGRS